jgi:hypothetical protein
LKPSHDDRFLFSNPFWTNQRLIRVLFVLSLSCSDHAVAASFAAEGDNDENSSGEKEKGHDGAGPEDPTETPHWMPMRVSLRWMYRLSDVVEDKGRDVPGHPCEVFISDHVTGPEVNSVNIIDGRAVITQDEHRAPAECEMNDEGERIYLCHRFYRHGGAPKPPKDMFPRHSNVRAKTIRELVTGELESILRHPSDSMFLFYSNLAEDKQASAGRGRGNRRTSGRIRKDDRSGGEDDSHTPAVARRKRRITGDMETDSEGDLERRQKIGSQSAPPEKRRLNDDAPALRPRRRSSMAADLRNRQVSDLYLGDTSDEEEEENKAEKMGGRRSVGTRRGASQNGNRLSKADKDNDDTAGGHDSLSRAGDYKNQDSGLGSAEGDAKNGSKSIFASNGNKERTSGAGKSGSGTSSGLRTRSGALARPIPGLHMLPPDMINGAFADLTEEQRHACRRNLPWIVDSMQTRMVAAGKVVTDELLAKVVTDVMRDYEELVAEQERSRNDAGES